MTQSNTAERLRSWLQTCPAISPQVPFHVDFLEGSPVQYALFSRPTARNYGTDVLGNVYCKPIQELQYLFRALLPCTEDDTQNLDNLTFFTQVVQWLDQQNRQKNFPEIEEGTVLSVLPTLSPGVSGGENGSGRYQIQLNLRYRRNRDTERMNMHG